MKLGEYYSEEYTREDFTVSKITYDERAHGERKGIFDTTYAKRKPSTMVHEEDFRTVVVKYTKARMVRFPYGKGPIEYLLFEPLIEKRHVSPTKPIAFAQLVIYNKRKAPRGRVLGRYGLVPMIEDPYEASLFRLDNLQRKPTLGRLELKEIDYIRREGLRLVQMGEERFTDVARKSSALIITYLEQQIGEIDNQVKTRRFPFRTEDDQRKILLCIYMKTRIEQNTLLGLEDLEKEYTSAFSKAKEIVEDALRKNMI